MHTWHPEDFFLCNRSVLLQEDKHMDLEWRKGPEHKDPEHMGLLHKGPWRRDLLRMDRGHMGLEHMGPYCKLVLHMDLGRKHMDLCLEDQVDTGHMHH